MVSEFLKLAWWSERRVSFSHYRTKDQDEVGVVIEDRRGRVVGIEVKASANGSAGLSGIAPVAGRSPRSFCARAGAARPSPCDAVRRNNCKLHRCRFCVRCKVA
ncbi:MULTISPECIES: DUF4143 domain-containing protein [unclassified Mesorhizobium]|uniref:DUF4143 domain-containing protein n=1 Tax=unclassified Mesorhizobium TaxID=325217 RepID=UPI00333C2550